MTDLVRLCKTADVKPGAMRQVDPEGLPSMAVYNLDGSFYVTSNMCTHGMAWLTDGYLEGEEVECPFHGGRFSIKTGEPTAFPCVVPIQTYAAVVEGDDVCIERPAS